MSRLSRLILATAVLMAAFQITALADGWVQDSKGWQYLKNGQPVFNEWQTDANGDYFYLGYDGYMVSNAFVDDDRFVDSTGRMVKSSWRQIDGKWYYFEGTGRMVTGKKKMIENLWYFFGDDGAMITGWYTDGADWYYCDPNGGGHMAVSTWKKLIPSEEMDSQVSDEFEGDGSYWFYFQGSGKAVRAVEGEYRENVINGNRYAFDQCGRMRTGWVRLTETTPAIAGYKFYNNDEQLGTYGAAHTGWLSAYVPEGVDDSGEVEWYYFDSKGTPAYGSVVEANGKAALKANLKKISKNGTSYSYLFNEKGNPVCGLQRVALDDGTITSAYFGTKNQSCLQKNVTSVTEADGTTWRYQFNNSGFGFTGVKNRYLFYKGKLQKAVDDIMAYYTVDGETYLVNQGGYVIYNYNKTKKPGEVEYRSDANGHRDGGTASESSLLEPEYPDDED